MEDGHLFPKKVETLKRNNQFSISKFVYGVACDEHEATYAVNGCDKTAAIFIAFGQPCTPLASLQYSYGQRRR